MGSKYDDNFDYSAVRLDEHFGEDATYYAPDEDREGDGTSITVVPHKLDNIQTFNDSGRDASALVLFDVRQTILESPAREGLIVYNAIDYVIVDYAIECGIWTLTTRLIIPIDRGKPNFRQGL